MECPVVTNGSYFIRLDDEKEFKTALKDGSISQNDYDKGYLTATALMDNLKSHANDIVIRSQYDIFRIKNKLNIK